VYFTFNNLLLIYDEVNDNLGLENINIEKAIENKKNFLFELIPQVEVSYCDNNICKKINLKDTDRNGNNASYRGNKIERNPACWNICEKKNFSQIYIIILFFTFFIFSILFLKFKKLL
jgi:hypothetical protein